MHHSHRALTATSSQWWRRTYQCMLTSGKAKGISKPGVIPQDIGRRISLLRYQSIFLMMFVHMPDDTAFAWQLARHIFQNGFGRAAVPMLSCISGYLLCTRGLERGWVDVMRRRAVRLLVPLVACNLGLIAALWVAQYYGISTYGFPWVHHGEWREWAGWIALSRRPVNPPLYFLRDLFVLSACAPIFLLLIRRVPWLGLLLVSAVFGFNLDGRLVSRGDMAINFYIGIMAAERRWNVRALDRYALLGLCGWVVLCPFVAILSGGNIPLAYRVLVPWLLWPASGHLATTRIGAWSAALAPASFSIFLWHYPLVMGIWRVLFFIDDSKGWTPYYWFWGPLVVATLLTLTWRLSSRLSEGMRHPLPVEETT